MTDRSMILILASFALAVTASAQDPTAPQKPSREGRPREVNTGFIFNSPMSVSTVREKQLSVGQRRFNDDVLLITAPELAFRASQSRTDFFIGYKPEGQIFKKNNHLKTLDHTASLRLTHWSTPRLVFDITDSYIQTEDPSGSMTNSVFILPRSQFMENTFRFNVDYELSSKTTLSPSFINTVAKLLLPDVRETAEFTGRFEQMGSAAALSLTRRITPRHQVLASYAFFVSQDLKRGLHFPFTDGSRSQSTHGVSASYRYDQEQQGISVNLSGGVLVSRNATYRAAAHFEKRWTSFIFFTGVSREISLLSGTAGAASTQGSGVLPDNFYEMATVGLRGELARKIGIDFSALVGRSNSGLQIENIESVNGRLRVSYRATNRIYPFVGAEIYNQSYSELLLTSLARRRYVAGISFVMSRTEEWQGGEIRKANEWPRDPSPASSGKGDTTPRQGGI